MTVHAARPTHDMSTAELLFEYVELYARNVDLSIAQKARQNILRYALTSRVSVDEQTLNAALVAPLIAACDVENAKKLGSASTVLAAKGLLKLEIEHVEAKCFEPVLQV